jgi:hypothetical protein
MDSLVERLRRYARDYTTTTQHDALIVEAADALEAAQALTDAAGEYFDGPQTYAEYNRLLAAYRAAAAAADQQITDRSRQGDGS